jgi:hypothetical protein
MKKVTNVVQPAKTRGRPKKATKVVLSSTQLELAKKYGITPEEFAKSKTLMNPRTRMQQQRSASQFVDEVTNTSPKAMHELVYAATSGKSIHDVINRPAHYTDGGIEVIDFIEAKRLGYHLGNVIKYICRAGKKGTNMGLQDLEKARWYLDRAIEKNEVTPPTR